MSACAIHLRTCARMGGANVSNILTRSVPKMVYQACAENLYIVHVHRCEQVEVHAL